MVNRKFDELVSGIENSTSKAFEKLLRTHDEKFYYFSLITGGEAHRPSIVAWSIEALDRVCKEEGYSEEEKADLKWSYSESPYFQFADEEFHALDLLFSKRPNMDYSLSDEDWDIEYNFRLNAMEEAMKRLIDKGIFSKFNRNNIIVNVEVMPPDYTNVERARRLNPEESLTVWLEEAAEEE